MNDSIEKQPFEGERQNPEVSTVHYDHDGTEGKLVQKESKASVQQKIRGLYAEIEAIELADTKVRNGAAAGIHKDAIADDVSMAGLSIPERKEAIVKLKQEKKAQQQTGTSVLKKIRHFFFSL